MLALYKDLFVQYWAVIEYIFLPSGGQQISEMDFFSMWWHESDLNRIYHVVVVVDVFKPFQEAELGEENM